MKLKISPTINKRYWIAISIASICGTNLGDVFPDVFKVSTSIGLIILIALFAIIFLANRISQKGNEAFYWFAILIVRAAATNIADFSRKEAPINILTVYAIITILFIMLVAIQLKERKSAPYDMPETNGLYWLTMLIAGTLGTVIADDLGHAFGEAEISYPLSAALATIGMSIIFGIRVRLKWNTIVAYYLTIVVVRWWGTNLGDISAYLITLSGSMLVTGTALTLYLWLSRDRSSKSGCKSERAS